MPKRYIDTNLIHDTSILRLSLSARDIWIRAICVADLFGIVPFEAEQFGTLSGLKDSVSGVSVKTQLRISEGFRELLGITKNGDVIEANALGMFGIFDNKPYFVFKPSVWDKIQGSLICKRTRSEYLRVDKELTEEWRQNLRISENSSAIPSIRAYARARSAATVKKNIVSSVGEEGGVGETTPIPKPSQPKRKPRVKPSLKGNIKDTSHISANRSQPDHPSVYGSQSPHPSVYGSQSPHPSVHGGAGGGVLDRDDPNIPIDLRAASPRAETRSAEVIRILQRIGHRTGIEKYQNISEYGYISDIHRTAAEIGYACIIREALKFEEWFCDQVESKKIKPTALHNPRKRFFLTWCERVNDNLRTTGDDNNWSKTGVDQYANLES